MKAVCATSPSGTIPAFRRRVDGGTIEVKASECRRLIKPTTEIARDVIPWPAAPSMYAKLGNLRELSGQDVSGRISGRVGFKMKVMALELSPSAGLSDPSYFSRYRVVSHARRRAGQNPPKFGAALSAEVIEVVELEPIPWTLANFEAAVDQAQVIIASIRPFPDAETNWCFLDAAQTWWAIEDRSGNEIVEPEYPGTSPRYWRLRRSFDCGLCGLDGQPLGGIEFSSAVEFSSALRMHLADELVEWAFSVLFDVDLARDAFGNAGERAVGLAALVGTPEWSALVSAVDRIADPTLAHAISAVEMSAVASGLGVLGPEASEVFALGYSLGFATAEIATRVKHQNSSKNLGDEKLKIMAKERPILLSLLRDHRSKMSTYKIAELMVEKTKPNRNLREPPFNHLQHQSVSSFDRRLKKIGFDEKLTTRAGKWI